jgi:hypothetical protein
MKKYQVLAVLLLFLMPAVGFTQKIKAKKVAGEWVVLQMNGESLPGELEMLINFNKDGALTLSLNGESVEEARWAVSEDQKGLTISMPDLEDEVWEIGSLTKSEMLIVDGTDQLLLRKKGAKAKKEKKVKNLKVSAKKLAGRWRATAFNEQVLPDEVMVYMNLTKDGKIDMEAMGEKEMMGTWSLMEDKKSLQIKGEDGQEEVWEVVELTKKNMKILSGQVLIDLEKEVKK